MVSHLSFVRWHAGSLAQRVTLDEHWSVAEEGWRSRNEVQVLSFAQYSEYNYMFYLFA